jgi:membrane-bound lytic murein transglycosylase D
MDRHLHGREKVRRVRLAALAFAIAFLAPSPPAIGAQAGAAPSSGSAAVAVSPTYATRTRMQAEPPAAGSLSHAQLPLYGIAMPWGESSFEKFRESLLSKFGRSYLAKIMERAKPYLPFVMERIAYYGLPEELAFLPVIESEYSPNAVSKSGAVGLWQFMSGSVRGYGMRITEWVDERKDFLKSTDGSLRKLRDNYRMFGDWYLALAAYNAGGGTVSRAIKRTGISDYWKLCELEELPSETRAYVPKFLAAASILAYRGREGFELGWDPAFEWALVPVGRPVDIRMLAERAGVPVDAIKSLNPELEYWITPPDDPNYAIKVPIEHEEAVRRTLAQPGLELMRFYLYKIAPGDTLSALSSHYDVSVDMILKYNPGIVASSIQIGQTLVIPALTDVTPYVAAAPEPENVTLNGTYVVKKGDTLWSIALMFGIRPDTLAAGNGLTLSSVLREGMTLKVPIIVAVP